jgi:hypothetical protein
VTKILSGAKPVLMRPLTACPFKSNNFIVVETQGPSTRAWSRELDTPSLGMTDQSGCCNGDISYQTSDSVQFIWPLTAWLKPRPFKSNNFIVVETQGPSTRAWSRKLDTPSLGMTDQSGCCNGDISYQTSDSVQFIWPLTAWLTPRPFKSNNFIVVETQGPSTRALSRKLDPPSLGMTDRSGVGRCLASSTRPRSG